MPTLLHLDSSARGERSVSRQLTGDFVSAWKQAHPGAEVIYRDIDQIVRVGQTFARSESGYEGLLTGKKATVITSSGGVYRAGSPAAPYNLQEPWIRTIFGFIGITDVDFIVADGVTEIELGKRDREQYLKPIREQVRQVAALAANGSPVG
jgi:FMN-dependent NADH-azoreductase